MRRLLCRPPHHPALTPYVEQVWWCALDVDHESERVLPTAKAQLVIGLHPDNDPLSILQGPASLPRDIDPVQQRCAAGIAFRVGGVVPFFGGSTGELADETVDLDAIWGAFANSLHDRAIHTERPEQVLDLFEWALMERLTDHQHSPHVGAAIAQLDRGASVGAVVKNLDVDRRWLARSFHDTVGFHPKVFARIRRFHRTLGAVRDENALPLAQLAAEAGFSDQAHFTREFRHFSGVTPSRLHRQPVQALNHVVDV